MTVATFDIAVVGGGLTGLLAAIAAAEAGANTVVIDQGASPEPGVSDSISPWSLLARATAAGADVRYGCLVWGIFGGRRLAVSGSAEITEVHATAVILTTGSVTVTEPSPGWTEPDCRLALMAECAFGYSAPLGGWVPGRSRYLETLAPGVFVAGDGGGLCPGPEVAMAEGRLAGTSAAASLGYGGDSREAAVAELERIAPGRLAEIAAIDAWYVQGSLAEFPPVESYTDEHPAFGANGPDDQTGRMICPCEGIQEAAILAAIAQGARSLNDVKRRTRAGMGVCQGVQCGHPIRTMICERTGIDPARVPPMTSRPPIRLLRLADLAGMT